MRSLGYLGYVLINLDIIDINGKLNIPTIEWYQVYYCWEMSKHSLPVDTHRYIIVGKGVQNICTKEYQNSSNIKDRELKFSVVVLDGGNHVSDFLFRA